MGISLKPMILPFWMRNPENIGCPKNLPNEPNFLFCSAAQLLSLIEAKSIKMMEGGIGAINFPLSKGMVGTKATRTVTNIFTIIF